MEQVTALLRERERQGLMLLVALQVGFTLLAVAADLALYFSEPTVYRVLVRNLAAAQAIGVASGLALLWLLDRRSAITFVGYCCVLGALVTTVALPLALYLSNGPGGIPSAFLTKFPVVAVGLTMLAFLALAFQPRYIVAATAGLIAIHLAFFAIAAMDPASDFAVGGLAPYYGIAVSGNRFGFEFGLLLTAGVILTVVARRAQQAVRDAVTMERRNSQLSRYFSPNVVAGIAGAGEDFLRPGGREQEIVVVFCDIVGFTALSNRTDAGTTLAMLSDYQGRMVREIFRFGGTLDKFIGDGIMATFGTPEPAADAADRAVAAALAMQEALGAMNRSRAAAGLAPIRQRIGIHAGPAIVGNVGTPERLEYTVIGDTVNLASRIEGACKMLGHSLLVSAAVKQRLRQAFDLQALPAVTLDGQAEAILLFAVNSGGGSGG